MTLLLQRSYIRYQRIDLSLGKFFAPCRHLTFSISDRIEDTFIGRFRLPFGIRKISRVIEFRFECLRAAVLAVTRITVFLEEDTGIKLGLLTVLHCC